MEKIKIGIIIPDRNDRPEFLKNCLRMIKNQTVQPDIIEVVNDNFLEFNGDGYLEGENKPDLTKRYRIGYDRLRNKNLDCILFIENDDYYAPNYIETMVNKWILGKKPDLLGTTYTIYYHINLFAWFKMEHYSRSSAMSTLIKPDLNFQWCADTEVYTDIHLWNLTLTKILFTPDEHICIGIKHGVGLCGGRSHVDRLERYAPPNGTSDTDTFFLYSNMDPESYKFYSSYFEKKTLAIDIPENLI